MMTRDVENPSGKSGDKGSGADPVKACLYLTANILAATSIIFANKLVLSVLQFHFVYFLTLLHVLTTHLGLQCFAAFGLYKKQSLPWHSLLALSAAFVGYIVFWNISLQISTVGFYQLCKICITPTALMVEAVASQRRPSTQELLSVVTLCIGVALATVTDKRVTANLTGLGSAVAAVCLTVAYQRLARSKQKELEASPMALMSAYTPIASTMLFCLVPVFEPLGLQGGSPETLLGYHYSIQVISALIVTALLGLAVSLSTFLALGSVSSVTFNVIGHTKTIIVLAGGHLLFGEAMPLERLGGICLALMGIVWFSLTKLKVPA